MFPEFRETLGAAVCGLVVIAISLLLIVLASIRSYRASHARSDFGATVAEYQPPEGLNVMVAAHLLDRPKTAIPAQLLELAVRKNLKMIERGIRWGATGYALEFLTLDGADPIERQLLTAIFGDNPRRGDVRELLASDRPLVRAITRASASAVGEAGRTGLRGLTSGYQWVNLGMAALNAVALLFICSVLLVLFQYSWWVAAAFAAATLAIIVSARSIRFIGPLTAKGAAVRDRLIGLRKYLELAEDDRLRMLQGVETTDRLDTAGSARVLVLYEKLLPYAVIWGIEDSWIRKLIGDAAQIETPPLWLSNPNGLSIVDVFARATNSWRSMAAATAPVGNQRVPLHIP